MNKCDLCESMRQEPVGVCNNCGYNFEQKVIIDKDRLQAFLSKVTKSKNWIEEVRLKKKINDIQSDKYGYSATYSTSGAWSERKTAELLGETKPNTSSDIRLAEALDKHPELLECKNKTEAKKLYNQIKNAVTYKGDKRTFKSESDLQKYLNNKWNETAFSEKWELLGTNVFKEGQYNTGEIGEIDLLAKHRKEKRWLIIELKLNQSSDETVGQILRYMGWVKENLSGEDGTVNGLIISETVDEHIRYALVCVPNISLKVYRFENGKLVFKDLHDARKEAMLKKLTPNQIKEILEQLENEK